VDFAQIVVLDIQGVGNASTISDSNSPVSAFSATTSDALSHPEDIPQTPIMAASDSNPIVMVLRLEECTMTRTKCLIQALLTGISLLNFNLTTQAAIAPTLATLAPLAEPQVQQLA
jgi:hypothetical protein